MSGVYKTIAVLPGDGIGPEVTRAATKVLSDCAAAFGHTFELTEYPFGGNAIDRQGEPLPATTLAACRAADAILLGAVGGPKWDSQPLGKRPESGLLALRSSLDLYINLRPIRVRESLTGISPLRPERVRGCNFEIVRELAGDIYFGAHERWRDNGIETARDVASYSETEIERVVRYAFERAAARHRRLASVDKANVLATSVLWRDTVKRIARDYPSVNVEHLYVDNAAMQIVLNPTQFDVIVTANLFGDILSDEAAALAGSIGLIPSMSRGRTPKGALYEPIHGSAPSLAGKDVASPLGTILCASLMLRESFGLTAEADWIEAAVDHALEQGYRTNEIAEPGSQIVGCSKMTECIRAEMADSSLHAERYGWGV
jgi:3-isopropylmalate dehydrogenase